MSWSPAFRSDMAFFYARLDDGTHVLGLHIWGGGSTIGSSGDTLVRFYWWWILSFIGASYYLGNWEDTCLYVVSSALQKHFWNGMHARLYLDGMTRCKIPLLKQMMLDIIIRICTKDSALGVWCVNRHEFKVLVNASSLATAVLHEVDDSTVEDICPGWDPWTMDTT